MSAPRLGFSHEEMKTFMKCVFESHTPVAKALDNLCPEVMILPPELTTIRNDNAAFIVMFPDGSTFAMCVVPCEIPL
jgi:hypothetical protein